jgi:uncharacterized damage-inducible protein DinB
MDIRAVQSLMDDNIQILLQAKELLRQSDDNAYTQPMPGLFDYTIGAQLRHCLDAWQCFFNGLTHGRIDYDQRERNLKIETSRPDALALLNQTICYLSSLATNENQLALECRHDSSVWALSSLERELQFLLSHTIHHFALIAVMLRAHGIAPPAELGVAPSTLTFWKESALCVQ